MASPTFTVLPCELSDMSTCIDIYNEAFAGDPMIVYFYPKTDKAELRERSLNGYKESFTGQKGARWFKAVDENSGEIVAFSKWVYPHAPTPPAEDFIAKLTSKPLPDGANEALIQESRAKFDAERRKWVDTETTYLMAMLAVRPSYQRQGLGSMLLKPVLEQADKEGKKVYITGSLEGLGLYTKFGWREVGEVVLDFRPYGGDERKTVLMMREPRGE